MLVRAIREIAAGRPYFCPSILKRLDISRRKAREAGDRPGKPRAALTAREAEVLLQLVAEGMANKQVAVALGISIKTVEKHRQKLMEKLNIHETAGLTRHAISTRASLKTAYKIQPVDFWSGRLRGRSGRVTHIW